MGLFLNPDNMAFQSAVSSEIYVDKTGLLTFTNKVLGTQQAFICNSRPRRFGKSITAAMLSAYYSKGADSKKLFAGLAIEKSAGYAMHLNKYDVIHFDTQWCLQEAGSAALLTSYISENILAELKAEYGNLFDASIKLSGALAHISEATGKRFIIIVDEWDAPIRDEAADQKSQEQYIDFLRSLFKGYEPSKYILLAFLTGILPIKRTQTQSALNNFDEYTMVAPGMLAPYIGFTEEEVQQLCVKYNRDFAKAKLWYDGYVLGKYQVYNPKAVVSLMLRGEYQSYWTQTGTYEAILPLINMNFDGLKSEVIRMLAGGTAEVIPYSFQNDMETFRNKDDVLTLLIHLGYLGYNQLTRQAFIPNEEIRFEFAMAVRANKWSQLVKFQADSKALLNDVLAGESKRIAAVIEEVHNTYASAIQYNDENSLTSVLCIAFLGTMDFYFKPIREMSTGRGFADLVYIPKPEYKNIYPALLIELKWNRSAKTALQQIKEKRYEDSLREVSDNILLVGISYDKNTKEHFCEIEKLEIS